MERRKNINIEGQYERKKPIIKLLLLSPFLIILFLIIIRILLLGLLKITEFAVIIFNVDIFHDFYDWIYERRNDILTNLIADVIGFFILVILVRIIGILNGLKKITNQVRLKQYIFRRKGTQWYLKRLQNELNRIRKGRYVIPHVRELKKISETTLERYVKFCEEYSLKVDRRITNMLYIEKQERDTNRPLFSLIKEHPFVIILGESGIGKTALLTELAFQQASYLFKRKLDQNRFPTFKNKLPWVINFAQRTEINEDGGVDELKENIERKAIDDQIFEYGLKYIHSNISNTLITKEEFEKLVKNNQLWFFCDNFDQLFNKSLGNEMIRWIIDSECRLIVTSSRIGASFQYIDFKILEIERLTPEEQKHLIINYNPSFSMDKINTILKKAAKLGSISYNPFYLLLIAEGYTSPESVPITIGKLLRSCSSKRIAGQLSHSGRIVNASDYKITEIMNDLGHFAFDLHSKDLTFLSIDTFHNTGYLTQESILLLKATEILGITSDMNEVYFTHRRWQEWFAGYYLSQQWGQIGTDLFNENVLQKIEDWIKFKAYDDTLVFCAETMDSSEDFIKFIAAREPVLAARMIYEIKRPVSFEIKQNLWKSLGNVKDLTEYNLRPTFPNAVKALCFLALSNTNNNMKYLKELMNSISYQMQEVIIVTLGKLEDEVIADFLREILDHHNNLDIRELAVYTLIEIGGATAVEILIEVLNDAQKSELRWAVCYALGRIGGEAVINSLIDILEHTESSDTRNDVAYALGKIGGESVISALTKVINQTRNFQIRKAAIKGLLKTRVVEAVIKELLKPLFDSGKPLRHYPYFSSDFANFVYFEVLEAHKDNLRCANNSKSRLSAAYKLYKTREFTIATALIDAALYAKNPYIRWAAATLMDTETETLHYEEDYEINEFLKEVPTETKTETAFESLTKALYISKDHEGIKQLVYTIDKVEDPEVIEILIEPLYTGHGFDVLKQVAFALGKLAGDAAIDTLAKALHHAKDPDVRKAAAYALGRLGGDAAIDTLVKALHHAKDPDVKENIADALSEIGEVSAIKALRKTWLCHNDSNTRWISARVLDRLLEQQPSMEKYWL